MQHLFKLLFVVILFASGLSCKKKTSDDCPTCKDQLCEDLGNNIVNHSETGPQFRQPFFNPNNADEFIYIKSTQGSPDQLIKHIISSGEELILCDSEYIGYAPQWGSLGWVVFSNSNFELMKIRDDGTGLTHIGASNLYATSPKLNDAGDRILVNVNMYAFNNGLPVLYSPILDLSGNVVDSVKMRFNDQKQLFHLGTFFSSFQNSYYFYRNESLNTAGYCRLLNNQGVQDLIPLQTYAPADFPVAICKNINELFHVIDQKGLYGYNLFSNESRLLIQCCSSRYIQSVSMSSNGETIIYEQVKGTAIDISTVDLQSEIYILNISTLEKTKIIGE